VGGWREKRIKITRDISQLNPISSDKNQRGETSADDISRSFSFAMKQHDDEISANSIFKTLPLSSTNTSLYLFSIFIDEHCRDGEMNEKLDNVGGSRNRKIKLNRNNCWLLGGGRWI
jgi:hypothetical protein